MIFEWYALYEQIYGRKAQIAFAVAWDIGDGILAQLDEEILPPSPSEDPGYELIHEALLATEKGIPAEQLDAALQTFYDALPAVQAGFILFRASVMPDQPPDEA